MSNFEVLVEKVLEVSDHPNADRLSIIKIRGFNCISAKLEDGTHRYNVGDLVIYIPEGSVVPENLLKLGFWDKVKDRGILSGSNYNRVKAMKFRGIVSQGIIFPTSILNRSCVEGENVAEELKIEKYNPEIPTCMSGEVEYRPDTTIKFDIENIQKHQNVLIEGEEVVITEKLHGTFCAISIINNEVITWSKGLGAKGLVFKNNEANRNNVYIRTLNRIRSNLSNLNITNLIMLGEVFGKGVQDLIYNQTDIAFRVFDVYSMADKKFANFSYTKSLVARLGLDLVPVLYEGRWDYSLINIYRDGVSTFGNTIKEGIIIKPITERYDSTIGRVILKAVSPDYLLRKGKTTEYV